VTGTHRPRLLDQVRLTLRAKRYSPYTLKSYVAWIRRFILFNDKRHPSGMGKNEIEAFLTHLAVERRVRPSTQGQALCAILFLYRSVLGRPMEWSRGPGSARGSRELPVVFTPAEVADILGALHGVPWIVASLVYGSGLRLIECLRLRVTDVDLDRLELVVRNARGAEVRRTVMPLLQKVPLRRHLARIRDLHELDANKGYGWVVLPETVARTSTQSGLDWAWQWVFPATRLYRDRKSGTCRRHHLHPSMVQRAVKRAVLAVGGDRKAGCNALRNSFAVHMLERGTDVRTVQQLLGHRHVGTTMAIARLVERPPLGVRSPLDTL